MSKNSVKVSADADGNAIVTGENPEYGYIRVEQERAVFNDTTGFMTQKVLSALVRGTIDDLKSLGWKAGQMLPGVVKIREQLKPFNSKDPNRTLKIAGDSLVVCKSGSDPIHRDTFYDPNPNATDVLMPHTNGDEIRAAKVAEEVQDDTDL